MCTVLFVWIMNYYCNKCSSFIIHALFTEHRIPPLLCRLEITYTLVTYSNILLLITVLVDPICSLGANSDWNELKLYIIRQKPLKVFSCFAFTLFSQSVYLSHTRTHNTYKTNFIWVRGILLESSNYQIHYIRDSRKFSVGSQIYRCILNNNS